MYKLIKTLTYFILILKSSLLNSFILKSFLLLNSYLITLTLITAFTLLFIRVIKVIKSCFYYYNKYNFIYIYYNKCL
jgi:hypothetical protein